MDYSEHIKSLTQAAIEGLLRAARATPDEKLNWKASDSARSVLEVVQDATQRTSLFAPVLTGKDTGLTFTPEVLQRATQERAQWTTLDACEVLISQGLKEFYMELQQVDDFNSTVILPFRGTKISKADYSLMPLQTFTYFSGQVNYIQTVYGDLERH